MVMHYLDSPLRVETLSFEEAADFNPQEWFIQFMTSRRGSRIKPPTVNRPTGGVRRGWVGGDEIVQGNNRIISLPPATGRAIMALPVAGVQATGDEP